MSFRSRTEDFIFIIILLCPHIAATFVALGILYSFSWYTLLASFIISLTNVFVLALLFEAPSIFTRILFSDFKNAWRGRFWTTVEARLTKISSHPPTYNISEIENWCYTNCVKKWDRDSNIFRFKNKRDAVFFKTVWK